jgi:ribonuclease P protein component
VRAELSRLPAGADLVVRARPEAADADSRQLGRDLRSGLDKLGLRAAVESGAR